MYRGNLAIDETNYGGPVNNAPLFYGGLYSRDPLDLSVPLQSKNRLRKLIKAKELDMLNVIGERPAFILPLLEKDRRRYIRKRGKLSRTIAFATTEIYKNLTKALPNSQVDEVFIDGILKVKLIKTLEQVLQGKVRSGENLDSRVGLVSLTDSLLYQVLCDIRILRNKRNKHKPPQYFIDFLSDSQYAPLMIQPDWGNVVN